LLVDLALELVDSSGAPHLHDCYTGSGCVAITIAAERPNLRVTGSDLSPEALQVAESNCASILGSRRLEFWLSNCLVPLGNAGSRARRAGAPRIITANPPYLTDNEYAAMAELGWPEPETALRAGDDGLDLIRRLIAQASSVLSEDGWLLCECGASQGAAVSEILETAGFGDVAIHKDLAGRDRVCGGRLQERHQEEPSPW
jgi:release factor glutamine methyltransferase